MVSRSPIRETHIGHWRQHILLVRSSPGETTRQALFSVSNSCRVEAYYLPPTSLNRDAISIVKIPNKTSLCEWKGRASYHQLTLKATNESVMAKVWSYESPTPSFRSIKDHLSFYASGVPWECFVDGEKVAPQEGR